jgi:methanogenic corrinoid protein MtbC1
MLDIGEQFDKRKLYLPHVVMASDIMAQANELIYEVLDSSKVKSTGKVIIGTVEGDIHELGKTIVAAMLKTSGFEVIDLGYDIPPKKFLEAGLAEKADLVACSALMSSTRPYLKDGVELRKETDHKDDYKIMLGGGAVNQEYADQINADIYAEDAMDAVHKAENALCR